MYIAFITSAELSAFHDDDGLAVRALEARGHSVAPLVWKETSSTALSDFDVVVMRTPWDWYRHPLAFQAFLERLDDVKARVFNPRMMMVDFLDKAYLRTLEQRGVPIVPTRWLTRDALETLPALLHREGWQRAVIKPSLSAGAFATYRFSVSEVREVVDRLRGHPEHDAYLVQPYLEEVERDGEWSLVFFAGQYSHAVRKVPKTNDFRVQSDHGGRVVLEVPTSTLVRQATDVVAAAVPEALYARVDGVVRGGQLLLMELEVVEPELFFRADAAAAERFADALEAAMTSSMPR